MNLSSLGESYSWLLNLSTTSSFHQAAGAFRAKNPGKLDELSQGVWRSGEILPVQGSNLLQICVNFEWTLDTTGPFFLSDIYLYIHIHLGFCLNPVTVGKYDMYLHERMIVHLHYPYPLIFQCLGAGPNIHLMIITFASFSLHQKSPEKNLG